MTFVNLTKECTWISYLTLEFHLLLLLRGSSLCFLLGILESFPYLLTYKIKWWKTFQRCLLNYLNKLHETNRLVPSVCHHLRQFWSVVNAWGLFDTWNVSDSFALHTSEGEWRLGIEGRTGPLNHWGSRHRLDPMTGLVNQNPGREQGSLEKFPQWFLSPPQ